MPARDFLNKFLPIDELPGYSDINFHTTPFRRTVAARTENDAYLPFIEEMQPFAPQLYLIDTHSTPDAKNCTEFSYDIKPDVCVYSEHISGCDSSKVEIHVEFKWAKSQDVFRPAQKDDSGVLSFIRPTSAARDTLGQITAYTSAQLGSQYRSHAFSVLIVRDFARIIRWDREGAIVTEPIEYNNDSTLADFFSRFSHAPPQYRGVDTTVTEATTFQAERVRKHLDIEGTTRMLKTAVPCKDGTAVLLVFPAPKPRGLPPTGRCTRGTVAYEWRSGRKVFLKDSWRICGDGMLSEGQMYERLNSAHVRNVPTCLGFEDVVGLPLQKTHTLRLSTCKWACPTEAKLTSHIHHRFFLNVCGKPLTSFTSARELVSTLRDALIAHGDAVEKSQVLHRDLSPGNVVVDGTGWLIDWDLAKITTQPARQTSRTGTWQFMSLALLSNQDLPHTVQDDLESAFYVLFWTALMYIPSEMTVSDRSLFMILTFSSK
ncbi:hypothetical protein EV363DRAFT_1090547, partial [Boletus edulis]